MHQYLGAPTVEPAQQRCDAIMQQPVSRPVSSHSVCRLAPGSITRSRSASTLSGRALR
jgi:hypothetical protein